MNYQLNQLFATLSNLTESSGAIAQVTDTLLNALFSQEDASAAAINCKTVRCGFCNPISKLRLCQRRCCRRGYPCYTRFIRVRC